MSSAATGGLGRWQRGRTAWFHLIVATVLCMTLVGCSTDGDDGTREGATPTTGPEDTSTAESTGRYGVR